MSDTDLTAGIRGALLFVPASRPERFAKAAASGAAMVILDLEDAVAPAAKDAARADLVSRLAGTRCCWRINAINSPWHVQDLARLVENPPEAVMLPKASAGPAFDAFCNALPGVPIIALVESAEGLATARMLAAHPAVMQLAFGSLDYCVDLDAAHTPPVLDPARCELVLASRLAGIAAPADGVTTAVDAPDQILAEAHHARALGMGAKLTIHPTQTAPVTSAFLPTGAEIDQARRILTAADGVDVVDGRMVDAPVKARARRLLALAGLQA